MPLNKFLIFFAVGILLPLAVKSTEEISSIQLNSGGRDAGEFASDIEGGNPHWMHIISDGTKTGSNEGDMDFGSVDDIPQDVFKSHRWAERDGEIRYRLSSLEDGSYSCNFYFVETTEWSMEKGSRVIDVSANGKDLYGIDIYDEVGSYNVLKKTISDIRVTNNEMDIIISAEKGYPSVNAISCHRSMIDTEDEPSFVCRNPEFKFNPTLGTCSENCQDESCKCFDEVEELMEFVFGRLMDELLRGEDAPYFLDVDMTEPSEDLGVGISTEDPDYLEILECKTYADQTCPNFINSPEPTQSVSSSPSIEPSNSPEATQSVSSSPTISASKSPSPTPFGGTQSVSASPSDTPFLSVVTPSPSISPFLGSTPDAIATADSLDSSGSVVTSISFGSTPLRPVARRVITNEGNGISFEKAFDTILNRISNPNTFKYSKLQSSIKQEDSSYCSDASHCGIVGELADIATSSLAEFLYEINDSCIGDSSCWCKAANEEGLSGISGSNGTDIIETCNNVAEGSVCPIIQKGAYFLEIHLLPLIYKSINGDSCVAEVETSSRWNNNMKSFKSNPETCKKKNKPKACEKMNKKIRKSVNQMKQKNYDYVKNKN